MAEINTICESVINGQFKQAKEQIQKGCKTKPELQAVRLSNVMAHLSSFYECAGTAERFKRIYQEL